MVRPELAIVIPSLNEGATIEKVVASVKPFGLPIVVSDGSTDDTAAVARAAGAHVVELCVNRGYDGALNAGFAAAADLDAEFVLTMDADGQHPEHLIPLFHDLLRHSADVVVGKRDRLQRVGERLFAWLGKTIFDIEDPLCGMKGYRMAVYSSLGHFDNQRSIGTELALFAVKSGFRVRQIDVPTRDRLDQPRFGRVLRANFRIFRAAVLAAANSSIRGRLTSSVLSYGDHGDFFLFTPNKAEDVLSTVNKFKGRETSGYVSFCDFDISLPDGEPEFQNYNSRFSRVEIEDFRARSYGMVRDMAAAATAPEAKVALLHFHLLAITLFKTLAIEKLFAARKAGSTLLAAPLDVVNLVHARQQARRFSESSTVSLSRLVGRPAARLKRAVMIAIAKSFVIALTPFHTHARKASAFMSLAWRLAGHRLVVLYNRICRAISTIEIILTKRFDLSPYRMLPAFRHVRGKRAVVMVVEDSGTRVNCDPALKIAASLISRGIVPLVLSSSATVASEFGRLPGALFVNLAGLNWHMEDIGNAASVLYGNRQSDDSSDTRVSVDSLLSPIEQIARLLRPLTRILNIQSVLTVYETLPLCVGVGFWARQEGYPWIGFFPILVGNRPDGHLFCADYQLVYGDQLADMIVSDGVAAANVHVVGSPTYDRFHGIDRAVERANLLGQFPKAQGKLLIVVATEAFPEPLVELDPILRTLSNDDRYHIVLKLHPEDSLDFFNRFVATLPGRERIDVVKTFPLEPLLAGCDLLICIVSNIAISASVVGTPVLICDFSKKSSAIDFVAEGLCFGCAHPEQLAASVENIIGNADFRATAREKVSRHIARFNGPNDGLSSDRIAEFALSARKKAAPRQLFYPVSQGALISTRQLGAQGSSEG